MKTYKLTIFVEVDEKNPNTPTLSNLIDVAGDNITTPDNKYFGIEKIEVYGEEVDNFIGENK